MLNINKRLKRLSITTRLTLLYSLFAFIILTVAILFLYSILINELRHENEKFLLDEIAILRSIIQAQPNDLSKLQHEIAEIAKNRYCVRILDKAGNPLLATTSMTIPPNIFPQPLSIKYERIEKNLSHIKQFNHYFLTSAWVLLPSLNTQWQLQISLDARHDHNIINKYTENLILVLIVGIFCFAFMSVIVARRGLRPLRSIANTTRKISAEKLNKRLDLASWPYEIASLAESFNKMLDRIENSFKHLSQFSADLAHELRTPINNLMGEAEIALSRSRSAEEYRHVLESALEEYHQLSRMIESLLFLARTDNAKAALELTQFDVKAVLLAMRDFYEVLAQEKNVHIECVGDTQLLTADLILFRRAVNNLLSNAMKYTPIGGTIKLKVEKPDAKHIAIVIEDTGSGIPKEHIPKLFDRFYRVDAARSKDSGGLGLGLAIVKSIMDLHQGTIKITSQVGIGTSVSLIFPL